MADFLGQQIDYVLFFYGLAFLLLGMTCIAIWPAQREQGWLLLGGFGLIHGAAEWLDLAALVIGDTPLFAAFRTAVLAGSYLVLFEYARRELQQAGVRIPVWLTWAAAGLVLIAFARDLGTANAMARYLIGLPAAVGAGAVFAVRAHALSGSERFLAISAAAAWLLYAVAAGLFVPETDFWPGAVLHQRAFQESTGIPIQLIRGVVACIVAACIWGIWGHVRSSHVASARYSSFVRRQFLTTGAALTVILLCGWALTEYFGEIHKQSLKEDSRSELDLLSASLAGELAPVDAVARSLAGSPNMGRAVADARDLKLLHAFLAESVAAAGAERGLILNARGTVTVAAAKHWDGRGLGAAKQGPDGGSFYLEPGGSGLMYQARRAIREDGAIVGTVVLQRSLAGLQESLASVTTPYFIVSPDKTVALTNKTEWLGQRLWPSGNGSKDGSVLGQELGPGASATVEGTHVYVGARSLNPSGWSLMVLLPFDGIFASRVLGIALTFLSILIVLVYIISRERAMHDQVQMARRLELEELARDLDFKAASDPLTGLWNRLKFDEALSAEVKRALRFGTPLSLILFDVDHFKRINDTYGHQVGDAVLVRLSNVIADRARATDLLARWGGEEFALLLPMTALSAAAHLAEALRATITSLTWPHDQLLTCSFGVGQWTAPETVESLLSRVDAALYEAKQRGRNRVEVSIPSAAAAGVGSAA